MAKNEESTFGDRMSDMFDYHWTRDGEPANEATRRLRRDHPDHYYAIRPALHVTLRDGMQERILVDATLGIAPVGYTADELLFRKRIDEGVKRIRDKGGIVDGPSDPGAPEAKDSGAAADYDHSPYHWTRDGEPANEATRKLRDADPERYFALRPALDVKIDAVRRDRIMQDVGLRIPAKGYTADELRFRKRLDEEFALIVKQGLTYVWKTDVELPDMEPPAP